MTAINALFVGSSNQLGAVRAGFVAAATTPTFSVVSGGFACLGVVAFIALALPELRRYRAHEASSRSVRAGNAIHHQVVAGQDVGRIGGKGRVPTSL